MKNYQLQKFLIAKTGVIFGSNKFGHKWIEIRKNGKLLKLITLAKPYHERVFDHYREFTFENL